MGRHEMTPIVVAQGSGSAADDGVRPLSFLRACAVEARKVFDTRAAVWLVAVAALTSAAFAGGRAVFPTPDTSFGQLAAMAALPTGTVVMVQAILLVASEFGATAPITFLLDPRRGRVLAAKATVVAGVGVSATLLAFAGAALVALVAPAFTGHVLPWSFDAGRLGLVLASNVFTALAGASLALAARNTPLPLVVLLVWPTLALLIGSVADAARRVLSFVDPSPFISVTEASPESVVRLVTSGLAWIVVPGVLGAWHLLRGDVS